MNSTLAYSVLLLCGAYSILLLQELPSPAVWMITGAVACLALSVRRWRGPGFFLLGFALTGVQGAAGVEQKLNPALAGNDLSIAVRIQDFADRRGRQTRLIVSPLESLNLPGRMRLSWYDTAETPSFGECWQLTVRLRRPRGLANPGGFDYEKWLFRQGIGATGYVRDGRRRHDCGNSGFAVALRRHAAERLSRVLPGDDASAVMLAITVGARHGISPQQWQRYAATGTSHLMAISGMHIGLAAWSAYLLVWGLLAATGRTGSHRVVAALAALFVAVVYATLSGFAVPARRALTMLALAVLGIVLRRPVAPGQFLGVSCVLVAATSPLDVLSPGFQLSFAAVAILLLVARRSSAEKPEGWALTQRGAGFLHGLTVMQFALLFGLLPLTAASFSRAAWLAPAVNLLVLPVFNLLTVPAALLGLLLDGPLQRIGDHCLTVAWRSVGIILQFVEFAARVPNAELAVPSINGVARFAVYLPFLWVLLPVGWPGRRLALIAAAASVLHQPARPSTGCTDIHVLDVGQGLANVIVTSNHVLVFDTGPAFRSGSDTGQLVVTPFLRSLGIRRIDLLVVSHADLDHSGGGRSLTDEWQVAAVLAGESVPQFDGREFYCRAGQLWQWDGVTFTVLHPDGNVVYDGNNASCVIEIQSGGYRALLTGDVEAPVERLLLRNALLSAAELVVIPHHGSATSSLRPFVDTLTPEAAVTSAGFANRWGMPKPEIVGRWRGSGAAVYNTAVDGAISFRLCAKGGLELKRRQRRDMRQIWHEY